MGALFAKWDSLNGDLYFQDYICIQLQMILEEWGGMVGEEKERWCVGLVVGGGDGVRFNTRPLSMNNSII